MGLVLHLATKHSKNVYKHWFTYLCCIALVGLCACAESDVLVDISPAKEKGEMPIGFSSSFVDHALTRHANELNVHLSSMGVWAWRSGYLKDSARLVFDDQDIYYNNDSAYWEYSPLQYWREGSYYEFCAYAPHQSMQSDARVSIDSATQMISIRGARLYGYNLQNAPCDTVKELFRDTPDVDWMVARAGQTAEGKAGMDVEFMMQHLLSKLNVRIKLDKALLNKPYISKITADSIVIGRLPAQGDFVQQLKHSPIISDPAEAGVQEWTAYDTTLYIKAQSDYALGEKALYIVESLVIPQEIDRGPKITLYYSYHFTNGCQEQCRYRLRLQEAFPRFISGRSYTLTFTISPKRIVFDTGVSGWEDGAQTDANI